MRLPAKDGEFLAPDPEHLMFGSRGFGKHGGDGFQHLVALGMKAGDFGLLCAFGAGYSIGGALLKML